ncbi:MAG: MBOAT family protein [Firmicutes bacterium]|nr:MBOAT family protein [Bacillota bacterium]
MVFSSIDFLLKFLPPFLAAYYFCPVNWRKLLLLGASLCFYTVGAWETPWDIALLLGLGVLNFGAGLLMEKGESRKKLIASLAVLLDMGILFAFKYAGFFAESINALAGKELLAAWYPQLPLGISFYTFMLVGYIADVCAGRAKAETNVFGFLCYVTFFPKLTSGPITSYGELNSQLKLPRIKKEMVEEGIRLFVFGMFLKLFMADQIGHLWSDINAIGFESVSCALAWLGLLGYSLQLYFDFWGYSLMAVGLGQLLGIQLPRNFESPYMSLSMTEFWRRWHMTLGTWFKTYIYFPLGGNRKGKGRTYLNMLCVWLFTGLWHGASWNFLLWGLSLFLLMAIERLGLKNWLEKHPAKARIYMLFSLLLTWMVFAIEDVSRIGLYLCRLIGLKGENIFLGDIVKYGKMYWWLLLIGVILSTDLPEKVYVKYKDRKWMWAPVAAAACLCGFLLYKGANDPFMYFRF